MLIALSVYFIPIILHARHVRIWPFVIGFLSLIFLTPTYLNIMSIYSISNIHDVTWGTRPTISNNDKDDQALKKLENAQKQDFKNYRFHRLLIWLIINILWAVFLVRMSRDNKAWVIYLITIGLTVIVMLKLIFAVCNFIVNCWRKNTYEIIRTDKIGSAKEVKRSGA
jgi:hypothetical protein